MPEPVPAVLAEAQALYDRGLYLQAWRRLGVAGCWDWREPGACILGHRLVQLLGDHWQSAYLLGRARQAAPQRADVRCFALLRDAQRDPAAALLAAGAIPEAVRAEPRDHAHELCAHAQILARMRDFAPARAAHAQAARLAPDDPWVGTTGAILLEREDRRPEALAAVDAVLAARPHYRPAVQQLAVLLIDLGRHAEAAERLAAAEAALECAGVTATFGTVLAELGRLDEADAAFARVVQLAPLLRGPHREWHHRCRYDTARRRRDLATARAAAVAAGTPWFQRRVEALDRGCREPPVLLPVPVVRQSHLTCVPATLVAIARHWRLPAEHDAVAADICYNGTPPLRERAWAERNGFAVREFTVTWEAARALLDRGVPFTLTTVGSGWAHLQGVVGYDPALATLAIREPGTGVLGEADGPGLLADQALFGPRGMALVPLAEAHRLDGLELPEAADHDRRYRLAAALARHDRAAAAAVEAADSPRMAAWMRLDLAGYDGDRPAQLAALDALLALHPEHPWLRWERWQRSEDIEPPERRLAWLTQAAAAAQPDEHVLLALARHLLADARDRSAAQRVLALAAGVRPESPLRWLLQADLAEADGGLARAAALARWAALCGPGDEGAAWRAWGLLRDAEGAETGLEFLRARAREAKAASRAPCITLYNALRAADRDAEADALAAELLREHRGDPEVALGLARAWTGGERAAEAAELLAACADGAHAAAVGRARARIHDLAGERLQAIARLDECLAREPQASDLHAWKARLLAEEGGATAATAYLEGVLARFPCDRAIHACAAGWHRRGDPAAGIERVRALLALDPRDAWAWRELGFQLLLVDRVEEAALAAAEAERLAPGEVSTWHLVAELAERRGERQRALAALQRAQELDLRVEWASGRLLDLCADAAEAEVQRAHLRGLVLARRHDGEVLFPLARLTRAALAPEAAADDLDALRGQLAGFWQAWTVAGEAALAAGRMERALAIGDEQVRRWPRLPRSWCDLADLRRAAGDAAGEIAALREALRLAPLWSLAGRQLAEALFRDGQGDEALALLAAAAVRDPLDAVNHGMLAGMRLRRGDREAGIAALARAAALDAEYGWAWDTLQAVAPERAEACARELVAARPGWAVAHWRLAMVLADRQLAAAEQVVRRGTACGPWHLPSWDLLVWILARQGRSAEAAELCSPARWSGTVPVMLVRRRALLATSAGRHDEAIAILQEHLGREPADEVAWNQLRQIAEAAKRGDLAEQALARLRQLLPGQAWVHREAARRLRDQQGAAPAQRQAWEAVLRLEPHDVEAACCLADLHRDAGDRAAALAAIAACRRRRPSPWLTAQQASLVGDDEAYRLFAELCRDPEADEQQIVWLAERLGEGEGTARWRRAFDRLLDDPPAATAGAQAAAAHLLQRGLGRTSRWLAERPPDCRFAARLLGWLLEQCADRGDLLAVLRLRSEHGARADADDFAWGKSGYALTTVGAWEAAARWARRWRERAGAEGWMLANATLALRAAGAPEAAAVSRHALDACPDHRGLHAAWLAFDAAIAGDRDELARLRDIATQDELRDTEHALLELAAAVAEPGFRPALRAVQRVVVRRSEALAHPTSVASRAALALAARTVAARAGGIGERLSLLVARLEGSLRVTTTAAWGTSLRLWWARQRGWG